MRKICIVAAGAFFLAASSAYADGQADTRSNKMTMSSQYYCVKNSESGACEDCVSKGDSTHESSTCSELKNAANNPMVRSGHCSDVSNKAFCKVPKK